MRHLDATKVKISGCGNRNTYNISHLNKDCCTCKIAFCQLELLIFLLFSLLSSFSIMLFYFLFELTTGMLRRALLLVLAKSIYYITNKGYN